MPTMERRKGKFERARGGISARDNPDVRARLRERPGRPPRLVAPYIPGVFTSNSMLKRLAFLSGLLSPQSPSIEPPPVAP